MSFSRLQTEHLRLTILSLLKQVPTYELQEEILRWGVNEMGCPASRDALRVQFAWMEEQGLLAVHELAGVKLAKLTNRGLDVAAGLALTPGVARPAPEDA